MSTDHISEMLRKLDELANITPTSVHKGLNRQQRDVPQLPAQFKPGQISVLTSPQDPPHPARKFFVGAESRDNAIQPSDEPYVVALVTRDARPRVQRTKAAMPFDRAMQLAKRLAHSTKFARRPFVTIYPQGLGRPTAQELMTQFQDIAEDTVSEISRDAVNRYLGQKSAAVRTGTKKETNKINPLTQQTKAPSWKVAAGKIMPASSVMNKYAKIKATNEDVLSNIKKRLGDYLADVASAIKQGDILGDKYSDTRDVKAVKTMTTPDGKIIQIRGNEDDGFRVSIKDQVSETVFGTVSEAETAVLLYQSRCGNTAQKDYMEER